MDSFSEVDAMWTAMHLASAKGVMREGTPVNYCRSAACRRVATGRMCASGRGNRQRP